MQHLKQIYNQLIFEALKPSEFRRLQGIARTVANQRIDGIWNKLKSQASGQNRNGERLYFNLDETEKTEKITPLEQGISRYLWSKGFEVVDFKTNQAKKKGDKNITKISKILTMIGKSDPQAIDILNKFNTSSSRGGSKTSPLIAISRAAYDIGGASTDRGWSSCMNLRGGGNRHYINFDISQGSMVAYYIRPDDLNIRNPMARIMIKPFVSVEGEDVVYGIEREDVKYGTAPPSFPKTIIRMLDDAQGEKSGVFEIDENLYQDRGKTKIVKISHEDKSKLQSKIKELKDGLTYDQIEEKFPWLFAANFSDAVLGLDVNKYLYWYSGTWNSGTWKYGIWEDGTWKGGIWYNGGWKGGTWYDGTWEDGTWKDGTWEGGTWKGGTWKGGTWHDGTWKGGTWKDGMWRHGTWEKGVWEAGRWKNGTWEGGTWEGGTWEDGVREDGRWKNGTWEDGTWKGGTWYNGTWERGTWEGGWWNKGTWNDGTWENGIWRDGTWEDGRWKDGRWENGTWKGGTWYEGTWESSEPHPNDR